MRVDIVDVCRRQSCTLNRCPHGTHYLGCLRVGQGDVIRVRSDRLCENLSIDACPPGQRVVKTLQDEDPGALAEDKSVALLVKRARRVSRVVVTCRQCAHVGKSANRTHGDRSIRRPRHDDVRIATPDGLESLTQHLGSARTGTDDGVGPSVQSEPHGYRSRNRINDDLRDKEGRNP